MASWVEWRAIFCRRGKRKEITKCFHDEDYSTKVAEIIRCLEKRGWSLYSQSFDIQFSDINSLLADD